MSGPSDDVGVGGPPREDAAEPAPSLGAAPEAAASPSEGVAAAAAEISDDHKFSSARWVSQVRLAASFLTILPVDPAQGATPEAVAASFGWFPLIGFAIGLALCAMDWVLSPLFGNTLRAVLIVLGLTVLTGGLHLDGVADTADALGAGSKRERVLEILRDSRIGSFGALALIFVITLKVVAIAGATEAHRYAAIYMAPGLGRWAMVALSSSLDYLRTEGAGAVMLSRDRRRNLKLATIIAVAALIPLVTLHALRGCVVAALATLALRSFYRRWVGGVTGDLIGAAGEIVETAVLIAASMPSL